MDFYQIIYNIQFKCKVDTKNFKKFDIAFRLALNFTI